MLSFREMEHYCHLIQVIQEYRTLLSRYDNTLKACNFDGTPRSSNVRRDQIDELLTKREAALEKLPLLESLEATQRARVEETIRAAAIGRGRVAVKGELILRARYQNGRSWNEIAEMIHEPNVHRVKELAFRSLEGVK